MTVWDTNWMYDGAYHRDPGLAIAQKVREMQDD